MSRPRQGVKPRGPGQALAGPLEGSLPQRGVYQPRVRESSLTLPRTWGSFSTMELEERSLDDNLEGRCAVCGAELTEDEVHAARESGPPFLCSRHSAEEVPLTEEEKVAGDDPEQSGEGPSIGPGGA